MNLRDYFSKALRARFDRGEFVQKEFASKCGIDEKQLSEIINGKRTFSTDRMETIAIKKVFANDAYNIPITAVKSMLGEGYSVSGSFQIMAGLLAINKGIIPPTINFQEKDPKCDLDYVINKSKKAEIDNVMINTFSPHGNNVSMIIGKYNSV